MGKEPGDSWYLLVRCIPQCHLQIVLTAYTGSDAACVTGEDPYALAQYAESFIKGMQSAPEDPDHIMAGACAKHYVANSMEGTTERDGEHHDRAHVDTTVTVQDLVDSYMPAFQASVEKANVAGLMCGCKYCFG